MPLCADEAAQHRLGLHGKQLRRGGPDVDGGAPSRQGEQRIEQQPHTVGRAETGASALGVEAVGAEGSRERAGCLNAGGMYAFMRAAVHLADIDALSAGLIR